MPRKGKQTTMPRLQSGVFSNESMAVPAGNFGVGPVVSPGSNRTNYKEITTWCMIERSDGCYYYPCDTEVLPDPVASN